MTPGRASVFMTKYFWAIISFHRSLSMDQNNEQLFSSRLSFYSFSLPGGGRELPDKLCKPNGISNQQWTVGFSYKKGRHHSRKYIAAVKGSERGAAHHQRHGFWKKVSRQSCTSFTTEVKWGPGRKNRTSRLVLAPLNSVSPTCGRARLGNFRSTQFFTK